MSPQTTKAESALTVSELTRQVKNIIESGVGRVWVAGEISNWRVSPAGHAYFTLKDNKSQLSAVIFKGKLSRLKFEPEGGLEVILNGQVTVYEQRGNYQIICDGMQPQGVGALQLAFDKLKAKLDAEGLFNDDHKKKLPMLPKKIGIVTSPTGAAIQDMLNVLGRRYAGVHVLLYPARVQGEEAAPEIVAGIQALQEYCVDVLIIGRGGGSLEDLWPFNEEIVVRAVHECTIPIVSAVGHEIDFSLSDFAADLRAPTPSAAAELVVQEHEALVDSVNQLSSRLKRVMGGMIEYYTSRIDRAQSSFIFRRPEELLRQQRQQLDEAHMQLDRVLSERLVDARHRLNAATRTLTLLSPNQQLERDHERVTTLGQRLNASAHSLIDNKRATFHPLVAQLDALSPLAILARGYSLVRKKDGNLVRTSKDIKKDDIVNITLGKGSATAVIQKTAQK